jgi:inosine-uridine nucleoside N-ribohydrolase
MLIIDTDMGVDDAIAVLFALKRTDILALTTCFGNTTLEQATKNAGVLLKLFGPKDTYVPIFRGSKNAMIQGNGDQKDRHTWPGHGTNGLGDVDFQARGIHAQPEDTSYNHASIALIEMVKKYPNQIDIVALGPLTNIAIAIKLCPDFSKLVRKVMVMGGCSLAKGNTSYCAEFNFWSDPEAVHVCLEEFTAEKFWIFPWEVTEDCSLSWTEFKDFIEKTNHSERGNFIRDICVVYENHAPVFCPCDAYAIVSLFFEDTILETKSRHCTIETAGKHTRGMLSIDWYQISKDAHNATIITKFNRERFIELLIEMCKN